MNSTYFSRICALENLALAYYKAGLRKRSSKAYLYFRKNTEVNVRNIQESLLDGTWECGAYRQFRITDPKERIITAAPFEDRLVHHAIVHVLEALFEKKFIFHTYACRGGKGTHAAIRYAKKFCKKGMFFLKLDVRKYFDSIDHAVLKKQLRALTNESKVQTLLHKIIDSYVSDSAKARGQAKGLPIGNLTSQYFANLYLSGLDHAVLEKLRPCGYVRYMDDMLLFARSMQELKTMFHAVARYTKETLLLSLKAPVFGRTADGIPFLGKLIKKDEIRPLAEKMRLKKKKIKKIDFLVRSGKLSEAKAAERISAIMADAQILRE